MTAVGRFFPCPRTARSRVRVRVRVRPCASYVVLPSFPWARHVSSTTAVGRFFPCPRTARSLVRVRVRVRPCASYVVLPSFPWRASCFVHDGRRPFFPVSTYSPFTGPCKGPCTCVCLVHGFAHFSMARVTFRPRRASAVFPTCPRTARSRVRVRVRVRPCASYVVLPSFPWHASRFVHDGRRPFFPVSTYSPFTGPCKGPCTSVCLVHGFAHFSMARVTFRPRRSSAVFSHVHVQPVHGSVYVVFPSFAWCASSSFHDSCPCLRY